MNLTLRLLKNCLLLGSLLVSNVYAQDSLSILSQNMRLLFDDSADGNRAKVVTRKQYLKRIRLAADKFLVQFKGPQVIALQEVENIKILNDIGMMISTTSGSKYQPVLLEGNDVSGIDVGYLIRSDLRIIERKQLFKYDRTGAINVPLFSRPPLLVEVCKKSCVTLVNIHLRSMRGLRSDRKSKRVAFKRRNQARRMAQWIDQYQIRNPAKSIIILGDFNALQPTDTYSDIVGTILGKPDNLKLRYPTKDWIQKDLFNLTQHIPHSRRFSYIYKGKQQILDYMLVNQNFAADLKRIEFSDIDRKFSDHAGLLAEFNW